MNVMTDAEEICACLMQTIVPFERLPPMFELNTELIEDIKKRLSKVGYELAMAPNCKFIAARRKYVFIDEDYMLKKDFNRDVLAMIMFLYSKLVAPKYLSDENNEEIIITYEQIWGYFKDHMNQSHFKSVLGTLRNNHFIKKIGKERKYSAGPSMKLYIDEKSVVDKLVNSVLFKISNSDENEFYDGDVVINV